MTSRYWLKLFHETIYDPKIMMRSPGARLRWYECLCLAGDYDKDGELPPIEHMLYVFRIPENQLQDELHELCDSGLFICENGVYLIKNWHDRQSAMDTNERSLRYRETKQKREYYEPVTKVKQTGNETATIRDADIDIDKEIDTDKEEEIDAQDGVSPIQRMIEKTTGILASGIKDLQAIEEIEKMKPTIEDIQGAYQWYIGQGKVFRYYSSLIECVRTQIAMRTQSGNKKPKILGKTSDGEVIYG